MGVECGCPTSAYCARRCGDAAFVFFGGGGMISSASIRRNETGLVSSGMSSLSFRVVKLTLRFCQT